MGIPVVVTHALDGQQVEFTLDFSEGSLAETLAAIHAELEEGEAVRPVGEYVLISPSRGAYLTAETWLAGGARWLEAGAELQLALAPAVEVRDQRAAAALARGERDAKKKLVFNLKKRLTAPSSRRSSSRRTGWRRCSSSSTTRTPSPSTARRCRGTRCSRCGRCCAGRARWSSCATRRG